MPVELEFTNSKRDLCRLWVRKRHFAMLLARSAPEGEADETGVKSDIDARRSAVGGRAVVPTTWPEQPVLAKNGPTETQWLDEERTEAEKLIRSSMEAPFWLRSHRTSGSSGECRLSFAEDPRAEGGDLGLLGGDFGQDDVISEVDRQAQRERFAEPAGGEVRRRRSRSTPAPHRGPRSPSAPPCSPC